MLFNSFEFIFIFLPLTLFIFYLLVNKNQKNLAVFGLAALSLAFYGYWNFRYVFLILASIAANYATGLLLSKLGSKKILVAGIAFNLLLLGYYKYCNFFAASIAQLFHLNINTAPLNITLPLAISFFTFTQIAYIVDVYRNREIRYDPVSYSLFVLFFPHLIAGPIVYHREIIPQFQDAKTFKVNYSNISTGILLFFIGLFKKVMVADYFSPHVAAVFDQAESPTFFEAWAGTLSYAMQIYFDFSGYTDMALGLARLFNIRMPHNFDSPYKSDSIIEFWRRWHITLSRFLRDYLYIPLGGNRRGMARKYLNLMITMLLGGLWHGAGWTFVVWGGLHGIYLCINHRCRAMNIKMPRLAAKTLTFTAVTVAWIFFRARDLKSALKVLSGCLGLNGFDLHPRYATKEEVFFILLALAAVNFLPNSQHLAGIFKPSARWLAFAVSLALVSLTMIDNPSEFLYFQF
ncbi:MAG: MBOAT family protein [Pelotomaculum sp.]|uniref:Predicted membrane protein n=1 Tax=Pelotomaculum thermopropionicum (strain DSM 13744 / JCM 10971 / SI) TaxID=370438 RepID=A5D3A9_PELTS|nr:MBOAT family protein [Pelotomaculum sp.]BAF59270.1 predicted membrane protein [Pelotomaculum thermopropionicum SI]